MEKLSKEYVIQKIEEHKELIRIVKNAKTKSVLKKN